MDTFKIRAVLKAAEYKSLSRAAQDFCYTPSAFSHILAAFEAEIGVTLFHRTHSGVLLTQEGAALMPMLRKMIECEQALLNEASSIAQTRAQELRIATYPSLSRNLLSKILREFRQQHPEIRLSVKVADSLVGWLEKDMADVIFADAHALQNEEWNLLMQDEYFAVVPRDMLPGQTSVTREELYVYPHLYTNDAPLRGYFEKHRFRELIDFQSEDDLSIINMVRSGMGIAVLPALVLKGNAKDVRVLRLTPPLVRSLGYAGTKACKDFLALHRFLRFLENGDGRACLEGLVES